jgi:hypothetical protein
MSVHADGTEVKVPPKQVSINEAHSKLGHCSESLTHKTVKSLGSIMTIKEGAFKPCAACGMGKANQRNVPQSSESNEPAIGERMHADISTIRKKVDNKYYVCPNWFMLVNAASGLKFLSFWNTKNAFIEPPCKIMH